MNLEKIKEEDLVVIRNGEVEYLTEVNKVTKLFVMAGGYRFNKKTGDLAGVSKYCYVRASVPTQEEIERIQARQHRSNLIEICKMADYEKLSNFELDRIATIIQTSINI